MFAKIIDKTKKRQWISNCFVGKKQKWISQFSQNVFHRFVDGFYYIPRIDREIFKKYKEDIIVLTGNLYGEVPSKILNVGEKQAEEALLWWKEEFGDDFYIELMRHNQEDENIVNETLLKFSKKHDIKVIASNNTFIR